jgi:hypothetical protein
MPLLHIVSLRFRDDMSEADVVKHFETEVALKRRMPELVEWWTFRKNVSLKDRADVNGGCQWVVTSKLFRAGDLPAYLAHPQHKEVAAIQASLLTGKFVVDYEVGEEECVMVGPLPHAPGGAAAAGAQ